MNVVSGLLEGLKQVQDLTKVVGLRVSSVQKLTPHMVRVTFTGTNLERFATLRQLHVRLHLPPPGAPKTDWLSFKEDGSASPRESGVKAVVRKYTVRRVEPEVGRVDIDFVVHGDTGPGSAWASAAAPGHALGMVGPGGGGLEQADWYLLAGDETALPAIARMLEGLPQTAQGHALIEVADRHEEQDLRKPAGVDLLWLHRNGDEAGSTTLLQDAIGDVPWPPGDLSAFAWVGTEAAAAQTIRAGLRKKCQDKTHKQLVVAHWRRDGKH